jgi:predicted small secreted protein
MQKIKGWNLAALAVALTCAVLAGCNSSTMIDETIGAGAGLVATGVIPCSRNDSQPASCQFAVSRTAANQAQANVTWADGTSRVIFFENGAAVRSDNTGAAFSSEKSAGNIIVRIGGERYDIPDAAIAGS